MKENLTELVFILDRSGSMRGLERDTIGGYNSFVDKQKAESGDAVLTTVLFDDTYVKLYDGADIKSVQPLTSKDYFVRGSTALLDAIGKTIDSVGKRLSDTPESERPSRVLYVITTDGMENSSREYTLERVRGMIEHQKSKYSWEFLFLGANIDALETAQSMGIDKSRAAQYCSDSTGVKLNFNAMSDAITCYRRSSMIKHNWKDEIDADFAERGSEKK